MSSNALKGFAFSFLLVFAGGFLFVGSAVMGGSNTSPGIFLFAGIILIIAGLSFGAGSLGAK